MVGDLSQLIESSSMGTHALLVESEREAQAIFNRMVYGQIAAGRTLDEIRADLVKKNLSILAHGNHSQWWTEEGMEGPGRIFGIHKGENVFS